MAVVPFLHRMTIRKHDRRRMPNPMDPIILPADLEFDAFFTFSLSYLNFCPKIRHSKFSVINEQKGKQLKT